MNAVTVQETKGFWSSLVVPTLAAALGLGVAGCEDRQVALTAPEKGPRQTAVQVNYHYKNSTVNDINLVFPEGKYRVSIVELKVSGINGSDSLKGGKVIFAQDFNISKDGTPHRLPLTVTATRAVLVVSGENAVEKPVQQWIILNAKNEEALVMPEPSN